LADFELSKNEGIAPRKRRETPMGDTTTPSSVRRELNQEFDALPIIKRPWI
jgi:hypothetical protein